MCLPGTKLSEWAGFLLIGCGCAFWWGPTSTTKNGAVELSNLSVISGEVPLNIGYLIVKTLKVV